MLVKPSHEPSVRYIVGQVECHGFVAAQATATEQRNQRSVTRAGD